MRKISLTEFIAATVLSTCFITLGGHYSLYAVILSGLLKLLILTFLFKIKNTEYILGGFFFFISIQTIFALKDFLVNTIYPDSSSFFFIFTLILATIYGVYMGIEGITRSAFIISVIFFLGLLFSIFGNIENYEIYKISTENLLYETIKIIILSPEILLFIALKENLSDEKACKKGAYLYILISTLILSSISLITTFTLGKTAFTERFPYYTVNTLAKISVFQRLDALYMSSFIFSGIIRSSIYLFSGLKPLRFRRKKSAD